MIKTFTVEDREQHIEVCDNLYCPLCKLLNVSQNLEEQLDMVGEAIDAIWEMMNKNGDEKQ